MNVPIEQRNEAYRREISQRWKHGHEGAGYTLVAQLSLEELKQRINSGIEPTDDEFTHVARRFEQAIVANEESGDLLDVLSTRLMLGYIRPIAWSDVLNTDSLKGAASRRAYERIGLDEAVEGAYSLGSEALALFDSLDAIPAHGRTQEQQTDLSHVTGFLGELTPLLMFGGRHHTPKLFATPSLAYDDSLTGDAARRVDVDLYDNRSVRTKPHYAFQVKTLSVNKQYAPDIPVLTARDFGNNKKSSRWPTVDKAFTSLRMLIREHNGKLQPRYASQLDRISSDVYRMISCPTERVFAAGTNAAFMRGVELGELLTALTDTSDESEQIAG